MQETYEMRVQSLRQEDPFEGEMATHSSILAKRIQWTEKPGGLQTMGLQSWTWLSIWAKKKPNNNNNKKNQCR